MRSLFTLALASAAGIGLASCAHWDSAYGYGHGYGYRHQTPSYGYGYGRPVGSIAAYWGWNGSYYYPGVGIYVYDRYRRPHRWSNVYRYHWQKRHDDYARHAQRMGHRPRFVHHWEDFRRRR